MYLSTFFRIEGAGFHLEARSDRPELSSANGENQRFNRFKSLHWEVFRLISFGGSPVLLRASQSHPGLLQGITKLNPADAASVRSVATPLRLH